MSCRQLIMERFVDKISIGKIPVGEIIVDERIFDEISEEKNVH